MYDDSGKNKRLKQNLLKQAFQETDGRVTKQEITCKDGKPIETLNSNVSTESYKKNLNNYFCFRYRQKYLKN